MRHSSTPERLQKVLARAGLGSRRTIESWIQAGRVSVNGRVASLGQRVVEGDCVRVDGRLIGARRLVSRMVRIIAYHKPVGVVCSTADKSGRPTVLDQLPRLPQGRWISIGRLDVNTSGLLLLTTDGVLANRMMHPSIGIERKYAVRVFGQVDDGMLNRLVSGVPLADGPASFKKVVDAGGTGANRWYYVTLNEGRNREVRRLWESQGAEVSRLVRVRYGPVILPRDCRAGAYWELQPVMVARLRELTHPRSAPVARHRGDGLPDSAA